jgi:(R,R)-butanediol dehydrogenase/meso-butanediol dehydrogenase/diacetyl reductase
MRAARYYGYRDLRVETVPEPQPGPGEVKVRVAWAGICGTDRHEYTGPVFVPVGRIHRVTGRTAPLVLGHEFAGVVAEAGEGVTAWRPGDRVTASGNIVCGHCRFCRSGRLNLCENLAFTGIGTDGAFAEYVVVPAYQLFRIPSAVPLERALLAEPLACGEHATRLAGDVRGQAVAVVGPGIIGLGCVAAARAAGAARILVVGRGRANEAHARRLGADAYLDGREGDPLAAALDWLGGPGFDLAYECVGAEATLGLAAGMTRKAGKVMVMGVYERPPAFPMNLFQEGERILLTSQAYVDELGPVLARMEREGPAAERLITARITLDRIVPDGFEELLAHPDQHVKIAVAMAGLE